MDTSVVPVHITAVSYRRIRRNQSLLCPVFFSTSLGDLREDVEAGDRCGGVGRKGGVGTHTL